jgi:hypothetical protein
VASPLQTRIAPPLFTLPAHFFHCQSPFFSFFPTMQSVATLFSFFRYLFFSTLVASFDPSGVKDIFISDPGRPLNIVLFCPLNSFFLSSHCLHCSTCNLHSFRVYCSSFSPIRLHLAFSHISSARPSQLLSVATVLKLPFLECKLATLCAPIPLQSLDACFNACTRQLFKTR